MATRKLEDFRPENQVWVRAIAKVFFNGDIDAALADIEATSQKRKDLDAKQKNGRDPKNPEVQLRFKSHQ